MHLEVFFTIENQCPPKNNVPLIASLLHLNDQANGPNNYFVYKKLPTISNKFLLIPSAIQQSSCFCCSQATLRTQQDNQALDQGVPEVPSLQAWGSSLHQTSSALLSMQYRMKAPQNQEFQCSSRVWLIWGCLLSALWTCHAYHFQVQEY